MILIFVLNLAPNNIALGLFMEGSEMQRVETQMAVSVSDLKKNPTAIMAQADGQAVAVLNHNRVMAYMVPADAYEAMIERLDDLALVEIAQARSSQVVPSIV